MRLRGTGQISRRRRGLTLGEMLVVLAVFSILAIMFFFSTNMAITKSKMSRVLHEQKVLANALTRYEGEYFDVPQYSLLPLATNFNYLTSLPRDPFNVNGLNGGEYNYVGDFAPNKRWLIVSVGPDGDSDVQDAIYKIKQSDPTRLLHNGKRTPLLSPEEAREFIATHSYDPTNGVQSDGDIILPYSVP